MDSKSRCGLSSVILVILLGLVLVSYITFDKEFIKMKQNIGKTSSWNIAKPNMQKARRVIILTAYMHGGSSIVGSLLAKDPSTTYIYEPGFHIERWHHVKDDFRDGSERPWTKADKNIFKSYFLQKLFKCDFLRLPMNMCELIGKMTVGLHAKGCSRDCIEYSKLYSVAVTENSSSIKKDILKPSNKKHCITRAYLSMRNYAEKCKKSSYISTKMLRYRLEYFLQILKQRKEIYLLHLIRDPRGIINSHVNSHTNGERDILSISKWICNTMKKNLEILKTANSDVTDRVKIITYENFAEQPLKFAMDLYKTLSLKMPHSIKQWVLETTQNDQDNAKYKRKNATSTAYQWKTDLTHEQRRVIDSICSPLLTLLHDEGKI